MAHDVRPAPPQAFVTPPAPARTTSTGRFAPVWTALGRVQNGAVALTRDLPDISRNLYWALVGVVIVGLMALWIIPFGGYYGWQADDWMTFRKALRTVVDWREAFTLRVNALQPYFFLYTWLPIRLGLSIPSMDFPIYGPHTGMFRFIAFMTILFHGAFLAIWAWLALRIANNRIVALFSVVAVAASPALAIWMPQNETRYIGLPLVILAILLVMREMGRGDRAIRLWPFALAGLLCSIGFHLHYTAAYMIVPILFGFGVVSLFTLARGATPGQRVLWPWLALPRVGGPGLITRFVRGVGRYWQRFFGEGLFRRGLAWIAFIVGFMSLIGLLEWVSSRLIGLPFSQGPLMGLLFQVESHDVPGIEQPALRLKVMLEYVKYALELTGPIMIALIALGILLSFAAPRRDMLGRKWVEWAVLIGVLVGVALILYSKGYPFYRKTLPLQPFMFLFAGFALVVAANLLTRRMQGAARTAVFALLVVGGGVAANWTGAREHLVLRHAHYDMGRLVEMAQERTRAGRKVHWLHPRMELYGVREIVRNAHDDDLLFTEFPIELFELEPSIVFALRDVAPIATAKRVWSTTALHAEHGFWIGWDMRNEPVMNDARLYRAGDLRAYFEARRPVVVTEIRSSDQLGNQFRAQNAIDHDSMGHNTTEWRGVESARPRWIEMTFDEAIEMDRLRVIGELFRPHAIRPEEIEIQVSPARGERLRTVARARGLAMSAIGELTFERQPVRSVRVIIHQSRRVAFGRLFRPVIEEIDIPGYDLRLARWVDEGERFQIREMRVHDSPDQFDIGRFGHLMTFIDPHDVPRIEVFIRPNPRLVGSVIYVDGQPLPTRYERFNQSLVAVLPERMRGAAGLAALCLAEVQVGGRLRQRLSAPIPFDRLQPDLCRGIRGETFDNT